MKRLLRLLPLICIALHPLAALSQIPSAQNGQSRETTKRMTAMIAGKVVWPGQDVSHANVSVYRDEGLTQLYLMGIPQQSDGQFNLGVEPGRYYIVAYVDTDKSGRFDDGDGIGYFGITAWGDKGQKKQVVELRENQKIHGIHIPITGRVQMIDGAVQIVPVSEYQASELRQFQTALSKATSGCRGSLILGGNRNPGNPGNPALERHALILAYTDLSWKYRAGIARVEPSGEWTLNLPPGKYYLMAILDNNGTNTLDAGDDFGFYGIENLQARIAMPQPVLVAANKWTEDLRIAITATYDAVRKNEEYQAMLEKGEALVEVIGTVSPPQAAPVRVHAYADSRFVRPLASTETDAGSTFRLKLPPGEYYLIATLDADGNGKYSEGDGLGGYGTTDIAAQQPTALVLTKGHSEEQAERTVDIIISAKYDANGQLQTALPGIETDIKQGSIAGRITFDGKPPVPNMKEVSGVLSLAYTSDFQSPVPMPITLTDDGIYHVNVLPGRYYVMAVIDGNGDGNIGITDGVGIYGTRFPVRGEPTLVTVYPGRTTAHIDIEIFASYIDENGTMAEIEDGGRWEIQKRYGQPADVFRFTRNGKQYEEWKYWTKGIGFLWQADGAGWKFVEAQEFKPTQEALAGDSGILDAVTSPAGRPADRKNSAPVGRKNSPVLTSSASGLPLEEQLIIYFAYDNVVWHLSSVAGLVALGPGSNPTVASDGTLLYQGPEGAIILHDNAAPQGRVVLSARAMAREAALSPDANYLAYTRAEFGERHRVVIRHIQSEEEFIVPSTAQRNFTPAWNADGTLLAYVTEGTIENSAEADTSRNIYAFDQVKNSVEPLVVSPYTDSEPTWSPANPNQLAFTRTVGPEAPVVGEPSQAQFPTEETQQIWLVTYSDAGVPTELQLTRYGGSHPVWMPPEGRWVLYENNGQLWTVDTLNPETSEMPLMHHGQVVFGHQPVVVSRISN